MATFTQGSSSNKNAEFIRVLMPVILIIILIVVGKNFLSGIWDGLTSPFKSGAESLGISNTAEENKAITETKKAIKEAEKENTAFDPNYYKTRIGGKIFTATESKRIAKIIYDAVGYMYDSPENILSAIKLCTKKTQLSFISKVFADAYGKDLLLFLETKLDTTSQQIILGKILNYSNKLK